MDSLVGELWEVCERAGEPTLPQTYYKLQGRTKELLSFNRHTDIVFKTVTLELTGSQHLLLPVTVPQRMC